MIAAASLVGGLLGGDGVHVGNVGGWHVSFHTVSGSHLPTEKPFLEFGCEQYFGEVSVTMPSGLDGGKVELTVEGIIDKHYAELAGKLDSGIVGRLYLFWRDTPDAPKAKTAFGGIIDLDGAPDAEALAAWQVIDFSLNGFHRTVGVRREQLVISGQDWTFHRMAEKRLAKEVTATTPELAIKALMTACDLRPAVWHGLAPAARYEVPNSEREGSNAVTLPAGASVVAVLSTLVARLENECGRLGRGMFLLRANQLNVGARPVPFDGTGKAAPWAAASGVVAVEVTGTVPRQGAADTEASTGKRRTFKVTSRGRPDIRPGDVVKVGVPREDASPTGGLGALGSLVSAIAGPIVAAIPGLPDASAVDMYVQSVEHRMGRTTAFVTTVTAVEVKLPDDAWDLPAAGKPASTTSGTSTVAPMPPSTSAAVDAANAVRALARTAADKSTRPVVGEVRGATSAGRSGSSSPPPQSSIVWRGLDERDRRNAGGRRHDVARPSPAPAPDVPYLTPVALPGCGLVLPRYPGGRVVVDHLDGRADEPVDVGALWRAGDEPKNAKAGDYWLILPVGYASPSQASGAGPVAAHSGKVTHDLIDADGRRVIQVGQLTVRVGAAATTAVGTRPASAAAGTVTIEHADGNARIVINDKGAISIEGESIAMKARGDLSIDAANVKVKLSSSGTMDVS